MEWVGGEALVPGYKGKREPPYSQKVMGGSRRIAGRDSRSMVGKCQAGLRVSRVTARLIGQRVLEEVGEGTKAR